MMSDPSHHKLPEVVILAGGFGTRVRHLLPDIPKPMAAVAGRPFIEWVVRYYARHGATAFALSTGFRAEKIESHFSRQPVPGVTIRCFPEKTALGTAGGFLNCLPPNVDPAARWLVVNGDSLVFADPHPLVAPLTDGRADAAVLGLVIDDAARYGSLDCDPSGRLIAFAEKRPGRGTINAGVYAFSGRALQSLPNRRPLSFEIDVFPALAQSGRVVVPRTTAAFLDIGTPATLAQAEQFIQQNQHEFLP
jgi:D-glycero-alpha-D-manno-heptose 1-phosphate guanylyltransferase